MGPYRTSWPRKLYGIEPRNAKSRAAVNAPDGHAGERERHALDPGAPEPSR
jgi:hypothetical protein